MDDAHLTPTKIRMSASIYHLVLIFFHTLNPALSYAEPCSTSTGYEKFIFGVPENTPIGSVIGVLDVNGTANEVTLVQNDNPYLTLDVTSRNIIVTKAFDTDNGLSTIILQVFCRPNSAISEIRITVRVILDDVNDNPPVFPRNHYYTDIKEDTEVGMPVFDGADATDGDAPGGGNDQIAYTILPGPFSDYFDIPYAASPEVILKKSLDYETIRQMTIEIQAQDIPASGVPLNATAFLTVNVLDVDDLKPQFSQPMYTAQLNSSVLPGYIVPISPPIKATDGDELNATVRYELVESSKNFIINESTAIVIVNAYLSPSQETLVLRATQTDNAQRYGIALLQLTIIGQGDNAPRFEKLQYEAVVSEAKLIGTTVITITATDVDEGSVLTYSIVGNPSEFSVDNSGSIILTERVDYERQTTYLFNLTASDGLYTAWTLVKIKVEDENDNNPEVVQKSITVVSERRQGTALTIVEAIDRDPNTTLTFELLTHTSFPPMAVEQGGFLNVPTPTVTRNCFYCLIRKTGIVCYCECLFRISQTGEIFILGSERDLTDSQYQLVVSVSDNGNPRRETVALVTVKFPAYPTPTAEMSNDTLAIVLGVIAAILLMIIVILIIYIIRRRMYVAEQLDRAKIRNGMDPRGLTYRPGDPSPEPSKLELHFNDDGEEVVEVDGTTIQDNPLSDRRLRYGFNSDRAHDVDEIHLDTAVIPYGDQYEYNGHRNGYQNNSLKTFHGEDGSSSGDSNTSDSTGDSNRGLMPNKKKSSFSIGNKPAWEVSSQHSTFGSDGTLHEEDTIPRKPITSKERPEITVYF